MAGQLLPIVLLFRLFATGDVWVLHGVFLSLNVMILVWVDHVASWGMLVLILCVGSLLLESLSALFFLVAAIVLDVTNSISLFLLSLFFLLSNLLLMLLMLLSEFPLSVMFSLDGFFCLFLFVSHLVLLMFLLLHWSFSMSTSLSEGVLKLILAICKIFRVHSSCTLMHEVSLVMGLLGVDCPRVFARVSVVLVLMWVDGSSMLVKPVHRLW